MPLKFSTFCPSQNRTWKMYRGERQCLLFLSSFILNVSNKWIFHEENPKYCISYYVFAQCCTELLFSRGWQFSIATLRHFALKGLLLCKCWVCTRLLYHLRWDDQQRCQLVLLLYSERDLRMVLGVGPRYTPLHFTIEWELPTRHFPLNPIILCHLLFCVLTRSKGLVQINDCFPYLPRIDIKVALRRI